MTTRLFLVVVTAAATLIAVTAMVSRTAAAVPPGPGPGPVGTGTGSCTGTLNGDVCTLSIYFGPSCIVTAAGALSCTIRPIDPARQPPPYPYQKCFQYTTASGAKYGICDFIPDDKTRCVVSHTGQLQCARF